MDNLIYEDLELLNIKFSTLFISVAPFIHNNTITLLKSLFCKFYYKIEM